MCRGHGAINHSASYNKSVESVYHYNHFIHIYICYTHTPVVARESRNYYYYNIYTCRRRQHLLHLPNRLTKRNNFQTNQRPRCLALHLAQSAARSFTIPPNKLGEIRARSCFFFSHSFHQRKHHFWAYFHSNYCEMNFPAACGNAGSKITLDKGTVKLSLKNNTTFHQPEAVPTILFIFQWKMVRI